MNSRTVHKSFDSRFPDSNPVPERGNGTEFQKPFAGLPEEEEAAHKSQRMFGPQIHSLRGSPRGQTSRRTIHIKYGIRERSSLYASMTSVNAPR